MQKIYDHRSSIRMRAEDVVAEHMALKLQELKTQDALAEYASWLVNKEKGFPFLYAWIKKRRSHPDVRHNSIMLSLVALNRL